MNLTVSKWLWENLIVVIGRIIEVLFRIILCILPLGLYLLVLQNRQKASSITSISVYTKEYSKFQHVFPGFLLVSINPNSLSEVITSTNSKIQSFIERNKYTLAMILMSAIVGTLLLMYVKGGY